MTLNRLALILLLGTILSCGTAPSAPSPAETPEQRIDAFADLRFGMFVCWSFSTFSNVEWTKDVEDLSYFSPTGCDVAQWCRTAAEAEMNYILFLSKHHDGFCLWDTDTTEWKVTNSPLGIDVLAEVQRQCDAHGLKLALYFSEGDWTWPEWKDPEKKKAQLAELLTRYGPIEYIWFDHAQTDGGLSHAETVAFCKSLQPRCLIGFNHGDPAGDLRLGEYGRPTALDDPSGAGYGTQDASAYAGYVAAEFTYPILGVPRNRWFYTNPEWDDHCRAAEEIYGTYLEAVATRNVFSLDVGPDRAGRLRDIDVRTLREVGRYVRGELAPPPPPLSQGRRCKASGTWKDEEEFGADKAVDGSPHTRWGAPEDARSGSLHIDLGEPRTVGRVVIDEGDWDRVRRFEVQYERRNVWIPLFSGETIGRLERTIDPVQARNFRLVVHEANEVPTILEFQLYAPEE